MQNKRNSEKPRIIVIPHYVGTEKADAVIKKIIADEVKKKICLNLLNFRDSRGIIDIVNLPRLFQTKEDYF